MRRIGKLGHAKVALLLSAGALALPATGHEIPNDVTVRVLVRPAGERISVLVRVPLEAMADIDFPATADGFLDFDAAEGQLRNAASLWLGNDIRLFENGVAVGPLELASVRASIPSDRSFQSFASALEHLRSPALRSGTPLVWQQALLDVLFVAPIDSAESRFSIETTFARLGLAVVTVIHYFGPEGRDRLFRVDGNSGAMPLDPGVLYAASRFLVDGFRHILDGADHLLFLLCLVIPFRRELKSLIWIVTAFTLAHSITLIGSAYGLAPDGLWFPPFVEMLIALSIFYMAVENALRSRPAFRFGMAFAFGLVHGFGFSFALRNTLQFAGDHLLLSLLSFNVGIELGQLVIVIFFVAGLNLLFGRLINEKTGVLLAAVLVGHTAWHWMLERYAVWSAFNISPGEALAALIGGPRLWLALALALVTAASIGWRYRRQRNPLHGSTN